MSHPMQATPGDLPDHEGNVWVPDSNTPNTDTTVHGDQDPVSGINILAKLGVQIGKVSEEVAANSDRVAQLARALERNTPVNASVVAVGTFATGVPLVLNFGQPDHGTFWEISSWAIGGVEVNTTATVGHVGLYTSAVPTLAGAGMSNLVDWTGTAPFVDHFSPGQVFANDGENIFCIVYGATNGQQYVSNIQFRVFNVVASQGQVAYTA